VSRYVEQAVDALYGAINTRLAGKLDDVETDSGLSAGSLPDPVAVLKYQSTNDHRTPLVQVYEIGFSPHEADGQRHGLYDVSCRVDLIVGSDADQSAGEVKTRRYVDALMRSVLEDASDNADYTLGGLALHVLFTGARASLEMHGETPTRHVYEFEFDVTVSSEVAT
jgi:hypothetical protein